MTLIENRIEQGKSVYKKAIHFRLTIVEMMNEKETITVKDISQKTRISIAAIRNYVQDLERAGELITRRQGKGKESKILDMWLTEEAIQATYGQILTCLPENDNERFFTLLEEKLTGKGKNIAQRLYTKNKNNN